MQHKDKFCFLIDNYELALKYKHKRRNIDPGLYNSNRLNEQPFPATRARNTTLIRRTPLKRGIRPKQKKQQRNIVAVQPNVDILSLDTPPNSPNHVPTENEPHSNTEPDVSKKLSFIDSLIIIQKKFHSLQHHNKFIRLTTTPILQLKMLSAYLIFQTSDFIDQSKNSM